MTAPRDSSDPGPVQSGGGLLRAAAPGRSSTSLRVWRTGLGILLLLSILVVGSLMLDVRQKLAELESSPQDNVQWTLSQFEVEFLAFYLATEDANAERLAGLPVDLTELRRRYDILYSRTDTLTQSEIYRNAFTDPQVSAVFNALNKEVHAIADRVDASDDKLITDLPRLLLTLSALRERIREVSTRANRAMVENSDAERQEVSRVLLRLAIATAFLLIILAAMVALFRNMAKTADRQLQDNLSTAARLETIFDTSRDGIVVLQSDGRIVNINRAAAQLFDRNDIYTRNAEIGSFLARRTDNGLTPLSGRRLFQMAAHRRRSGIRLTGLRPDGSVFPVEMSVGISTRGQQPICVCVIRDISYQIQAETELKDSRDQALAGERAKARFLGVVSHEMRTPLNGILGTLDLIEEDRKPDAPTPSDDALHDTYIPVLRNASQSLLTLVNDVLDITQIEGGIKLTNRPFDLDQLLDDIVMAEAAAARRNNNTVDITSPARVGAVEGDPDRLRQVMANLIGNAVKYTSDGMITIEANRLSPEIVELHVVDTGIGMTEDETDRIFDDFVRTDRAIEQQIPGTGLGLGIAKTLIEAMGGEIGVESEPGEGTLFWLRIPLPQAQMPDSTPATSADQAITPARILLVEDNATNRFIARRLLENDGHQVVEAENGQIAVERAGDQTFDLILMDISMPVMDGVTAARTIRNGGGPNANTRIVALTAHLSGGLDEHQTQEVMAAVLHKPLDRVAVRRQIAEVTGAASHGPVPTPAPKQATTAQNPLATLIAELDPAVAARLIDQFIAETDEAMVGLPDLIQAPDDDTTTLARLHDMAGACASFGLTDLHHILVTAEHDWRNGEADKARTLARQALDRWPDDRALILAARLDAAVKAG